MRAAYKIRREPSRSGRRSCWYKGWFAGQRRVPSGCGVKAEPGKPWVKEGRAHCGGPYMTADVGASAGSGPSVERTSDSFSSVEISEDELPKEDPIESQYFQSRSNSFSRGQKQTGNRCRVRNWETRSGHRRFALFKSRINSWVACW